jgi:hypothetical protein
MRGAVPPFLNTPSWHGAQLKHSDKFDVYLSNNPDSIRRSVRNFLSMQAPPSITAEHQKKTLRISSVSVSFLSQRGRNCPFN